MTLPSKQALGGPRPRGQLISRLETIQAPVGGLNARDALSAMKPQDALILENFVCNATSVDVRKGQTRHVGGFATGEIVKALHAYRAAPADKMFATTDSGIYDVTTLGEVGAKVANSTNGRWESLEGSNAGLHYLLMVNGTDPMKFYNGTAWADANITGIESTKFTNLCSFKFRTFFTEKGTLTAWYLDVNAVQGVAKPFELAPIFVKGGSLQAIGTWSIDGGSGMDDYCVFLTSEGEAAVYKGTDVENADNWALVGVYSLPRPIGRRCLFKFGGDLIVITESGLMRFSSVLQSVAVDRSVSISDKIVGLLNSAATNYKMNVGWQLTLLGADSLLVLNVPMIEDKLSIQYVMNTLTGAWSSFSGLNATAFLELGGRLFYSTKEQVVQAMNTEADFGANITAKAKLAFNVFRQGLMGKQVKLVRVNYRTSRAVSLGLNIAINYDEGFSVRSSPSTPSEQSRFNVSFFDQAVWAPEDFIVAKWKSIAHKPGYALSLMLLVADKNYSLSWNSTDMIMESGFSL